MIINRSLLESADIGFQTRFNLVIEGMRDKLYWRQFALEIPSTHRSEQYPWVTALPRLREWISDATFSRLEAYRMTLENLFWQAGLEVKREDLEDDNLAIIRPAIDLLAENAARHPDQLIFDLMMNGFDATKGLAYDGQYFFDTDHKDGTGAVQSNKGTAILSAAAFEAALVAMMKLKDEAGEPLSIRPTHLVVGPDLWAKAREIVGLPTLANGATNPNFGAVQVVVVPRLTAFPTRWFLFDLSRALRPFIFQMRQPLQLVAQDRPTDDNVFLRRLFRWSVDARYNAGYSHWQMSYGSDGTVTP